MTHAMFDSLLKLMPHNSGPAKRDMLDSHGAGKGDADRSPKWREHYDEVEWGQKYKGLNQPGFESIGPGRIRKTYGPVVSRPEDQPDWRKPCDACNGSGQERVGVAMAECPACSDPSPAPSEDFQPVTETGLGWQ